MMSSSNAFGHAYGMEDVVMDDGGVLHLTYNSQSTCPNGGPFVMAHPFGLEYRLHGLKGSMNPTWKDMAWKYNPTFERRDGIRILFNTAPRVYAEYTRVSLGGCLDMLSHPANHALSIRETWPNLVEIGDLRRREATILFMTSHGDQYWIGVRDRTVDPPDLSLTHYYESDTPEKYETGLGSIVLNVVGDQCLRQFLDTTLLQIPLDRFSGKVRMRRRTQLWKFTFAPAVPFVVSFVYLLGVMRMIGTIKVFVAGKREGPVRALAHPSSLF